MAEPDFATATEITGRCPLSTSCPALICCWHLPPPLRPEREPLMIVTTRDRKIPNTLRSQTARAPSSPRPPQDEGPIALSIPVRRRLDDQLEPKANPQMLAPIWWLRLSNLDARPMRIAVVRCQIAVSTALGLGTNFL